MIQRGWWLCLAALAAGCAGLNPPAAHDPAAFATLVHTPAPASNLTRTAAAQPTRNDYFRVHLLLPEGGCLRLGDNPVHLRILDRRGDSVDGALVKLQLWLPSQALDGPACRVRETEAGLYQVSGLNLSEPGEWMLTVTINRFGREDWAAYDLAVAGTPPAKPTATPSPPRAPGQAEASRPTSGAPAKTTAARPADKLPAKLSLARSSASDKGLYQVAYLSRPAQAKPNQPVAWRVKLQTKSGRPVSGAKLRVSLSRPPDVPGQSAKSIVGKDQGKGYYLVEGLRFPDKGWWRASLDITGKSGADRVNFNLVLE